MIRDAMYSGFVGDSDWLRIGSGNDRLCVVLSQPVCE